MFEGKTDESESIEGIRHLMESFGRTIDSLETSYSKRMGIRAQKPWIVKYLEKVRNEDTEGHLQTEAKIPYEILDKTVASIDGFERPIEPISKENMSAIVEENRLFAEFNKALYRMLKVESRYPGGLPPDLKKELQLYISERIESCPYF